MSLRRLPDEMLRLLEQSGLSWSLESRRRHNVLRVAGKIVLALPRSLRERGSDQNRNAVAALKRHIRSQA